MFCTVNHNIIHVKSQLFLIIPTAFDQIAVTVHALRNPQPFLFTAILRLLSCCPLLQDIVLPVLFNCFAQLSAQLFSLTSLQLYTTFTSAPFLIFSLRSAAIRRRDDAFTHHEPSAVRNRLPGTISDIRTISNFPDGVNRHSPQIQPLNF